MKLRSTVDAVMVGAGTVRADDPALTVRGVRGAGQPWRVVWAPRRLPPKNSQLARAGETGRVIVLRQKSLAAALRQLARRGIRRVLLEGGGYTLGKAFDADLVREVAFYVAPTLAGGNTPAVGGRGCWTWLAEGRDTQRIGGCLKISGRLKG